MGGSFRYSEDQFLNLILRGVVELRLLEGDPRSGRQIPDDHADAHEGEGHFFT